MPITTNNHHDKHTVRIHLTQGKGPHYAALRCVDCNKHIQWLSVSESKIVEDLGVDVWKYPKVLPRGGWL